MNIYAEWDEEKIDPSLSETEENPHSPVEENAGPNLKELQAKLAQQEKILSEIELRHAAEMANLRTRHAQQLEMARKFALEKFLKELLPIMDSLEHAHQSSQSPTDNTLQALQQGIEATLKLLLNFLTAQHVQPIEAINIAFDPECHHAMNMTHHPDIPVNRVTHIYQKGYRLHSRLLRPAIVSVNSAPKPKKEESACPPSSIDAAANPEEI